MYAGFHGPATPAFQLALDARFFFENTVHHRTMAYMVYGVRHTEGLIIIIGEVGAGKTILVNNLLSTGTDNSFVAVNMVSGKLAGDDLLHLIAAGFGIAKERLVKGPLVREGCDLQIRYNTCRGTVPANTGASGGGGSCQARSSGALRGFTMARGDPGRPPRVLPAADPPLR